MEIMFGKRSINIPTPTSIDFERVKFVIKERCVGRKWVPSHKYWFVPASKENFLSIKNLLSDTIKSELEDIYLNSDKRVDDLSFLRGYQNETVKDIIEGKKLICLPTGAGKTITALSYLEVMKVKKSLFIVPSPLKKQWQREFKKFFNRDATILEGSPKKRKEILDSLLEEFILIVGYETARVTSKLKDIHFELICFDEAHKLKNHKTKTYKHLKSIDADQKILLTATPMVNRPTEIFNVVNFAHPNYFDYYMFHERYVLYEDIWIGNGFVKSPIGFKNLSDLHDELKSIMVFKRKEDILSELPEKISQYYWIDATKEQIDLTDKYYDIGSEVVESDKGNEYHLILACMTMMRRLADSTELLLKSSSSLALKPKTIDAPKIKVLNEDILPNLEGKTIIFTEYADMADILYRELSKENPMLIKGGMDTQTIIDSFEKSTTSNILISTDVLNFGVNLQFASNVIHYDLSWSPAKITQREGRIHRIGQTNKVLFIYLITKNTVEEKVFNLLNDKKDMFQSVISGGVPVENEIIKEVFR